MQNIVVLSYQSLTSLIESLRYKAPGSVRIRTIDALLEEAIPKAKEKEERGEVDVFVSAGANAKLLSKKVKRPFVEIKVTGFDILLALKKARRYSQHVGIITYESKLPYLDEIADIIKVKIKQVTYQRTADIEGVLDELLEEDIQTVIGSSLILEFAQYKGMQGVFIYSRDSVTRALDAAVQIALSKKEEAEKAEELRTILGFAYEGIIAINKDGITKVFNPVAEKITGIPKDKALGCSICTLLPNIKLSKVMITRQAELNEIQSMGGKKFLSNFIPIMVNGLVTGAVATFQDIVSVQQAEEKIRKNLYQKGFFVETTFDDILATSPVMLRLKEQALFYARSDYTIIILGESGTGKELFARGIHKASPRSQKPFVAINCGAFPETLLESELFGYEEGAFTGARKGGKPGVFELAHGGTIFLDEIADMPLPLQAHLLRVLEEREVMRIGGGRILHVDIRVVASTNKKLWTMVEEGGFRDDLYYRLNILDIRIPPLREHREDIPLLVSSFLPKLRRDLTAYEIAAIAKHPMLLEYDWPGNVREVKSFTKRFAVLFSRGSDLSAFIASLFNRHPDQRTGFEKRDEIRQILQEVRGNKSEAAKRLGISRTTLWRRLKEVHRYGRVNHLKNPGSNETVM